MAARWGSRSVRGTALAVALSWLGAGCAKELPPLPLRPEPVAWADTLPIREPEEQDEQRIVRVLTVQAPYDMSEPFRVEEGEALNRTHLDDVVASSWWEPRMGYRDLTPEEIARGPAPAGDAPDMDGKLVVRSGKLDGVTAGFVMDDAKGDTYIIKFDHPDWPWLQSGAGAVVNRLMWGAGYWVPADYVATLDAADLSVDEESEIEEGGVDRPMTMEDVAAVLDLARPGPDGRYRVVASKFVPGAPKGPFLYNGTREDDPNDHFRHEHRRELRGLRIVSAWVNDTDRREGNTLDVWIDDPGYLRHYQIDFAAAMGSSTDRPKHPKDDVERPADFWRGLKRLASLGFYEEGWEDDPHPVIDPALGFIKVESFDPDEWKSAWDNPAFFAMTEADGYWAAKIVSSFTDDHIRAAVEEGHYPERWVVDTLTEALARRRDMVMARYFSSVTPLEEPRLVSSQASSFQLSFQDLGIERGVWLPSATWYRWSFSHPARGIEVEGRAGAGSGEQSLAVAWEGGGEGAGLDAREQLAVLSVLAVRDRYWMDDEDPTAATVWLRWDAASGRYRVVGLEH